MLKKTMLIGVMCVSLLGISQTQCNGVTKDSNQCKNVINDVSNLCHLHNPNYVKKNKDQGETVTCSGTTKKNQPCKNRTKDKSGKCHNHRND